MIFAAGEHEPCIIAEAQGDDVLLQLIQFHHGIRIVRQKVVHFDVLVAAGGQQCLQRMYGQAVRRLGKATSTAGTNILHTLTESSCTIVR